MQFEIPRADHGLPEVEAVGIQVLREMPRVGRGIVAFPNFGHWRMRPAMLLSGRIPRTSLFPYVWHESPNIHLLTVHDFENLAREESRIMERRYFLSGRRKVMVQPNLMAEVAVFRAEGREIGARSGRS